MITLFGFGPAFGLPDPSPFVFKTEILLKMAGLRYRIDTQGFRRAPKGKLPYIEDEGTLVADSTLIRFHLERKYGIDFDAGTMPLERGVAWAVEKMLEDNLYWAVMRERWMDDVNFKNGLAKFFDGLPALIRPLVRVIARKRVGKALKTQGTGRHSRAEMCLIAERTLTALSAILGDNPFLLGDHPCGADATVFAFVAALLSPAFDSPLRILAESHPNLVSYRDRMFEHWYHRSFSDEAPASEK